MTIFVAVDVGCLECGIPTVFHGTSTTETGAREILAEQPYVDADEIVVLRQGVVIDDGWRGSGKPVIIVIEDGVLVEEIDRT